MPKIVDRDQKQRELLDAALRVFSTRGFRSVSMAAVAVEAGMSKSALYHYYGSKDALVDALVARLVEGERAALEEAAAAAPNGEVLEATVTALIASAEAWARVGPVLIDLLSVPSARAVLKEGVGAVAAELEVLVAAGQRAGSVRADLPALRLAGAVVACVDGALMLAILGRPLDPEATAATLLRLLSPPA